MERGLSKGQISWYLGISESTVWYNPKRQEILKKIKELQNYHKKYIERIYELTSNKTIWKAFESKKSFLFGWRKKDIKFSKKIIQFGLEGKIIFVTDEIRMNIA